MTSNAPGSLNEVLSSAAAALGSNHTENTLELPEVDHYVVLLVDGMGELLLNDHAELAPFLSSGDTIRNLRSVVPSTTSANLTSVGTGLLPGRHGMAGYTCRIPGTQRVLNTLRWDDSIDPEAWQPNPTVFDQVNEDIAVAVVNDPDFEHSGLTRSGFRGAEFVGAKHAWERSLATANIIERTDRALVYCYESRLDFAGHAHGVDSSEWREMLTQLDTEIRDFRDDLPNGTALLVTADHGMVDVPAHNRFDVVDHPDLLTDVVVIAGEARFRHLHTTAGQEQAVAERWRERLGDKVEVRLRENTEDWFGPLDPSVAGRFGDVLIASLDNFAVFNSKHQEIELLMTGFHGSVTPAERSVPLRVWT